MLPADQLAAYAEQLRHLSERIVGAVYDDGPDELQRHIDRALTVEAPPGVDPVVALVTVLAAQIDPDTTASERLAWCDEFEPSPLHIRVAENRPTEETSTAAPDLIVTDDLVAAVTRGEHPLSVLPSTHWHIPIRSLLERHKIGVNKTAARLRCNKRTVMKYRRVEEAVPA